MSRSQVTIGDLMTAIAFLEGLMALFWGLGPGGKWYRGQDVVVVFADEGTMAAGFMVMVLALGAFIIRVRRH